MKAVLVRAYGDVNQLFYGDTPDLKPGPGEVLVRMSATSINPIDWKLRRGDLKAIMPLHFRWRRENHIGRMILGGNRAYADKATVCS
jgi:NADPH:quinone reductase-like Zn-dependent oxidoreductase